MNHELENKVLDLIEKQLEDRLSDLEITELDQLVTSNETVAKFYSKIVQQHALLHMGSAHMSPPLKVEEPPQLIRTYLTPILSIAALLFIGVGLWTFIGSSQKPPSINYIAEISHSRYAKWGNCTIPTAEAVHLTAGRLQLLQGLVTLKFKSGAEMVLEGAVDIELMDEMNTRLHSGIVVTEIPESAKGFTILTPTSKAVDHGTKFLTQVSAKGDSTIVNVLEGEVEVIHDKRGAHHIFEGEMIKTTTTQLEQRDFEGEIGLGYETQNPNFGFSISTADGQGTDGTAFKMNQDFHYNSEMVMIKNSDSEFNRKGYLKFDLSLLEDQTYTDVELSLNTLHSQYGSVALSQESTEFTVYAITDDRLDHWQGGLMNWERAPSNAAGTAEVQLETTIKLGSYHLPKGKVSGKVSFSSQKLLETIQSDKNRVLTLIIVHESLGDQVGQNYVFALASNKHPSLSPPTLVFKE